MRLPAKAVSPHCHRPQAAKVWLPSRSGRVRAQQISGSCLGQLSCMLETDTGPATASIAKKARHGEHLDFHLHDMSARPHGKVGLIIGPALLLEAPAIWIALLFVDPAGRDRSGSTVIADLGIDWLDACDLGLRHCRDWLDRFENDEYHTQQQPDWRVDRGTGNRCSRKS